MRSRLAVTVAATLSLAACGEGEEEGGPLMSPGSDCLSCHTGGEPGRFTAAGTVYPAGDAAAGAGLEGVTVTLTGSAGTATMVSNAAGNFFTSQDLGGSIDVRLSFGGVTVTRVDHLASSGVGCGQCHAQGLQANVRVHLGPNRTTNPACAACHGP